MDTNDPEKPITGIRVDRWVFFAAIFMLGAAISCLATLLYIILFPSSRYDGYTAGITFMAVLVARYLPHVILLVLTMFCAYVGYRLLVAAGIRGRVVIPREDQAMLAPLIAEGKADSIDLYVRLSSLTGFTGGFTKLGLTGLPLATIGLTIFFALIGLANNSYLDLAKLTLGAFIGSFVQGEVERRASRDRRSSPATAQKEK